MFGICNPVNCLFWGFSLWVKLYCYFEWWSKGIHKDFHLVGKHCPLLWKATVSRSWSLIFCSWGAFDTFRLPCSRWDYKKKRIYISWAYSAVEVDIIQKIPTRMHRFILYLHKIRALLQSSSRVKPCFLINLQAAEIERRIEQEAKAEKHIRKLLLLGMWTLIHYSSIRDKLLGDAKQC